MYVYMYACLPYIHCQHCRQSLSTLMKTFPCTVIVTKQNIVLAVTVVSHCPMALSMSHNYVTYLNVRTSSQTFFLPNCLANISSAFCAGKFFWEDWRNESSLLYMRYGSTHDNLHITIFNHYTQRADHIYVEFYLDKLTVVMLFLITMENFRILLLETALLFKLLLSSSNHLHINTEL